MIVSRWLGTLVETSGIMSENNKHLSDSNWEYKLIITRMVEIIRVVLQ